MFVSVFTSFDTFTLFTLFMYNARPARVKPTEETFVARALSAIPVGRGQHEVAYRVQGIRVPVNSSRALSTAAPRGHPPERRHGGVREGVGLYQRVAGREGVVH